MASMRKLRRRLHRFNQFYAKIERINPGQMVTPEGAALTAYNRWAREYNRRQWLKPVDPPVE